MSALREIAAHFGIEFDTEKLEKGGSLLDSVGEKVKGFATTLGAGFALKEIFEFTHGLTEQADKLAKQADAMGLSMKQLQEWNYVAMMAGVSSDQLQSTLTRLGATASKNKAISALGISLKNQDGTMKNSMDLFEQLGTKIYEIQDPAKRAEMAVKAFGKQGLKLLPIFEDGQQGINDLRKEFAEFGGGFDPDFAKKADAFGDNVDRIKTMGRQMAINALSRMLPAFLAMTKSLVMIVKPMINVLKNSRVLETGLMTLGISGVGFLSGKIGGLGGAMGKLLFRILPLIAAFLILEDLWGFFKGDDSAIGDLIERAFGKGSSEKVRQWVRGVWKEFTSFIDDIKNKPQKISDDWALFVETLQKDISDFFGPTWGTIINTFVQQWLFGLDILTGGWDNAVTKIGAMWSAAAAMMTMAWIHVKSGFLLGSAEIEDAFRGLFRYWLGEAEKMLGFGAKISKALGKDELAKELTAMGDSFHMTRESTGSRSAEVANDRDAQLAQQRAAIEQAKITMNAGVKGGAFGIGSVQNTVNVTVPPGTPAQQAAAVAASAKAGTAQGINLAATQAATKPGGP